MLGEANAICTKENNNTVRQYILILLCADPLFDDYDSIIDVSEIILI
jgi:hypothetical protein